MGKTLDSAINFSSMGLIETDFAGQGAQDASMQAAGISAEAQREALDYIKQREKIPQQFREDALQRLGGMYGMEGGTGDQQEMIDQAQRSPLYDAIMGTRGAGEESIMRNASMTGGMRSGNVQDDLFSYTSNLENTALNAAYGEQMQGLQGLAQLPSNANQIAQSIAGIGRTEAMGVTGAAQAKTQADQNFMNMGLQAAGMMI